MNHIEQVIKEAESAGYDSEYPFVEGNLPIKVFRRQREIQHVAFLDPAFWQALGKARGWETEPCLCKGCQTIGVEDANHMHDCPIKSRPGDWRKNWHRFIDHLASGGDAETFFEKL